MRNIDANMVGKLVEINWMLQESKYRSEFATTGLVDTAVGDIISKVPGGYSWFNHLEDRQRKQLVSAVYDKLSELF